MNVTQSNVSSLEQQKQNKYLLLFKYWKQQGQINLYKQLKQFDLKPNFLYLTFLQISEPSRIFSTHQVLHIRKLIASMDNIIENSLNFWQQRLHTTIRDQTSTLIIPKKKISIVDRVVIKSACFWNKMADEFLAQSSTNRSMESLSSQPNKLQISDC
ncbi:unnamed protein product (macronuclear) [Paramecium tetraurelia]|uniref:Uncharacterized protein n=1 Tax=Paramecium tetraurelia TaxID=5888 RepID=A0BNJ1_PARTE|nr:uncharacterized protein GSPATT00030746001 [Paramecium tetraurelia]CAK60108.1 unnamed protein product [Paramecium tetraurelia]|eukprot:XP_001427506.1 hypothetical protein (macronuclear) [Paramecium tetraurelia strain d4-2]